MALSDYTSLLYIEAQGEQYINLSTLNPNALGRAECAFTFASSVSTYAACLLGSSSSSNNARIIRRYNGANSGWNFAVSNVTASGTSATNVLTADTRYKFDVDFNNGYGKVNDTIIYNFEGYPSSSSSFRNLYLLADNDSDGVSWKARGKLEYFVAYDRSGNTIMNLIPAIRKSDSVVGMYDKINDVFYENSGSGAFIAGPVTSQTFNYTGDIQTYTVPLTGSYKLEVWGAKGGNGGKSAASGSDVSGATGANGGYSIGHVNLTEGDTLYICCGGQGTTNWYYGGTGGYNGGGNGSTYVDSDKDRHSGGGGGGATHIATVTGTLSQIGANNLDKVLIVAGGGGGAGLWGASGAGGGLSGGSGTSWAGGTQTTGYAFGSGQNGSGNAGGGGGGLYGGRSGTNNTYNNGGAGGGSGYVGNLIGASSINGENNTNGKAIISYVNDSEKVYVSASIEPLDVEGAVEGLGSYISGETVSLKFIDLQGKWKLKSWTQGGVFVSNSNPYIFTITENTSLVANAEKYGRCILM